MRESEREWERETGRETGRNTGRQRFDVFFFLARQEVGYTTIMVAIANDFGEYGMKDENNACKVYFLRIH